MKQPCPHCGAADSTISLVFKDGTRTRRCMNGHLFPGEPVWAAGRRQLIESFVRKPEEP